MEILIITGGSIAVDYLKDYLQNKKFDHVIAADSGLSHCEQLGLNPTEILGDFDSLLQKELLENYKKDGVPVLTFPTRKDFTDTHLAILYALDLVSETDEAAEVTIIGATGTRLDHGLANIGLLTKFADHNMTAKIVDEHNIITMLKGPCKKIFYKEDRPFLSILACSKEVSGITLEGFDYPLCDAKLQAFDSRGISNEILENQGTISVKEGYLLIIQSRD